MFHNLRHHAHQMNAIKRQCTIKVLLMHAGCAQVRAKVSKSKSAIDYRGIKARSVPKMLICRRLSNRKRGAAGSAPVGYLRRRLHTSARPPNSAVMIHHGSEPKRAYGVTPVVGVTFTSST